MIEGWFSLLIILGLVFIGFCLGFVFNFTTVAPAVLLLTSFVLLLLIMYIDNVMLPPLVIGFIMGLMIGLNI